MAEKTKAEEKAERESAAAEAKASKAAKAEDEPAPKRTVVRCPACGHAYTLEG